MYSTKNISNEKVTENPTFASESDAETLSKVSTQTMAIETDDNSVDLHEIETYVVQHGNKKVCRTFTFDLLYIIKLFLYILK